MKELQNIMEENDFSLVVEYSGSMSNTPNRAKIEDVVQEVIGQPVPNRTMRFIVHSDNDKWFLIWYTKDQDKFLFEKLTAR